MAQKRVLVIDDEPRLTEMVKLRLEGSGYEVITAEAGRQGIEKAIAEKPDLILLDIMMPEIDGFEVCERLRENEATKATPVIFLSALGTSFDMKRKENIERARQLKVDGFITKPFVSADLLEKVKAALAQKR